MEEVFGPNFLEEFIGRIFFQDFFGRNFFGRIFLGEKFWESFGRNYLFTLLKLAKLFEYGIEEIDLFVNILFFCLNGRKEEI